jgi:hypothetical protein
MFVAMKLSRFPIEIYYGWAKFEEQQSEFVSSSQL